MEFGVRGLEFRVLVIRFMLESLIDLHWAFGCFETELAVFIASRRTGSLKVNATRNTPDAYASDGDDMGSLRAFWASGGLSWLFRALWKNPCFFRA